jgi:hypothetical protein
VSDNPVKRILVELDCLLDTRYATLKKLNRKATETILKDKSYWLRIQDDFTTLTKGAITQSEYLKAYAERDKETLKQARPTGIVKLLSRISKEVEAQKISLPMVESLKIEVNIYPYILNEAELDVLATAVMFYGGLETEVIPVSLSLKQLNPKQIKQTWDAVILYNFNDWFTIHAAELNANPIPRHLLYAPALTFKSPENAEDFYIETPHGNLSPFTALEMCFVPKLCLEFLKPAEFSLLESTR